MSIADRLLETIQASSSVSEAHRLLQKDEEINIKGAVGALKSLFLATLLKSFSTQIVYIAVGLDEVEAVKEELEVLVNPSEVAFFPSRVKHRYRFHGSNTFANSVRLSALEKLVEQKSGIIVLNARALLYRLPARANYLKEKISLNANDELEFEYLVARLINLGFKRELRVERSGEMSVRGGLIDVFPFSAEQPYRIEFWGNRIESMRQFDPLTQRSIRELEELDLYPYDFIYANDDGEAIAAGSNILDFLTDAAIVVLDEPKLVSKAVEEEVLADLGPELEDALPSESESEGSSFWKRITKRLDGHRRANFVSIGGRYSNLVDFGARSQESFRGNFKSFRQHIENLNRPQPDQVDEARSIFFLCDDENRSAQMEEILMDEGITVPNLHVATLRLHNGFFFPDANLAVYMENQFYGRERRLRLPRKYSTGLSPKQLKYLGVGDYVVHVDFGVGIFRGLKKIKVRQSERECLHLEYKDGDNVYVRLERMDRVHKYSSKDGTQPKLSKLGTAEWQRLKARTKKKIKDIAQELIEVYAKRKAQNGVSFSKDTLWQKELEASFPFEDTPDQRTATIEVKRDMENPRPMDRLVCGDVGFGKTEIAVRAAFKAVVDGKQVAMLVPTTILAYQHYHTFTNRLANFPVQVEMLSRFRTRSEQKQVIEGIKNGQTDIVIGTHRLLSKDIEFKDLGLLVIDEEQRFGVRHKERLKRLRTTVDVLTLTATPIPRTLYLSLMGARDITNINTPPKNRLPIHTETLPFNKDHVREAILREIDRGGQVFFVHNRVRTIDRVATMLSGLVPEAKVAVGHGQMDAKDLEKVMIEFMERKYDILVSTMIIENGLDMPNVNTIIVNRADKLGLAQLYQLRGRVGRSHNRAYAYLLIPPIETLTEEALKRLRALEEFSEIGSGQQLAMRDLEIRGAGNLLGAEQSGYIDALGFDVYNKIVNEAVKELRAEQNPEEAPPPEIETQVDLNSDAYLPETYIESSAERVDIYRRLTESDTLHQIEEVESELHDRFGAFPSPVKNLIGFFSLRILGNQLRMKKIQVNEDEMIAEFDPQLVASNGEPFKKWVGSIVVNASSPFEFVQEGGLSIRLPIEPETKDKYLFLKNFLQSVGKSKIQA